MPLNLHVALLPHSPMTASLVDLHMPLQQHSSGTAVLPAQLQHSWRQLALCKHSGTRHPQQHAPTLPLLQPLTISTCPSPSRSNAAQHTGTCLLLYRHTRRVPSYSPMVPLASA